jgi:prepilin-type N-terminal cleavage/methylation domain-containing protein
MSRGHRENGFTIMEVMVAIMILAVSVVSIFGAQFAAVATTEFSRGITHAINLADCKMSEIELKILTEDGFQLGEVSEHGECCEAMSDAEIDEFSCEWEIKPVELPDLSQALAGGADGGLGLLGDLDLGASPDDMPEEPGGMDLMGSIESIAPMLSEMLSEGIRRVTVTVRWKQGNREPEFVLSQFIVHPTEGSLDLLNTVMTATEAASGEDDETSETIPSETSNPLGGGIRGLQQ